MRKRTLTSTLAAVGTMSAVMLVPALKTAQGQDDTPKDFVPPTVFQGAGPTISSIQGVVDQFRAALGTDHGNAAGNPPFVSGRREINWDGLGSTATSLAPTPFTNFLVTRGALFTTPGTGFVQAPLDGLVTTFGNPTYNTIFQPFSQLRLFTPTGSNVTEATFFQPGGGNIRATTTGFGAIFTDVDQPDGSGPRSKRRNRASSTLLEYFGADGQLLFSSFVPASPGDASLSFFGIVFSDARIARVRITSGDVAPGPNDGAVDVVVMDDFIYGEPQRLQ